jgi:hypothetical protein
MKQVNLAYYHYYRKKYGYCRHLWQGRYKSVIIESDRQALECGKYIELNLNPLITPSPEFESLGSDILMSRKIYANFVISPTVYSFAKH